MRADTDNARPRPGIVAEFARLGKEINTPQRPVQPATALAERAAATDALLENAEDAIEPLQIIQPFHAGTIAATGLCLPLSLAVTACPRCPHFVTVLCHVEFGSGLERAVKRPRNALIQFGYLRQCVAIDCIARENLGMRR